MFYESHPHNPVPRLISGPSFKEWREREKLSVVQVAEHCIGGDHRTLRQFESGRMKRVYPWLYLCLQQRLTLFCVARFRYGPDFAIAHMKLQAAQVTRIYNTRGGVSK